MVIGVDISVMKLHHLQNIFDLVTDSTAQITEQTVLAGVILFIKALQFKEMKFHVKNLKVEDMDNQLIISNNRYFN